MALPEYPYVDVEDYLALDNGATSVRYEYIDGTLRMLAGGSPNHSIIANNISTTISYALRKKLCVVYNPNVRLRLAPPRYVHPDVTIGCDDRDKERDDFIQYPCVLVEVLGESTEVIDRGEKLSLYLACPTLTEYLLVGSQKKSVEVYHRENGKWMIRVYMPGSIIHLDGIDVDLPFDDIMRRQIDSSIAIS